MLSSKLQRVEAGVLDDIRTVGQNTAESVKEIQDGMELIHDYLKSVGGFFSDFKANMTEITADLMVWTYETLTKVVLHTPSFLFDSEWLKTNTVTFTGLSLVVTVSLAIYEGFNHLISGVKQQHGLTPMSRIYKRLPLVLGVSAVAPSLFYWGFQGLNWLTDKIIGFTSGFMYDGVSNITRIDVTSIELFMFALFDIALIGMLIPIFYQNFRRWFELLVLATITPLALSCWMFESKEQYFHMWWDAIKRRSSVQLVYAVYILIIGTLMFGTKMPEDGWELLIKAGVMIGGLAAMSNPPSIVRGYIGYHEDLRSVARDAEDAVTLHHGVKNIFGSSFGFMKRKFRARKTPRYRMLPKAKSGSGKKFKLIRNWKKKK